MSKFEFALPLVLMMITSVILGFSIYGTIVDSKQIKETFTELRSEKVSLGVDPVLEEKPDSDKKSRLKALYNKYEELESEIDGDSRTKSIYVTKIGNDKQEIRDALLK